MLVQYSLFGDLNVRLLAEVLLHAAVPAVEIDAVLGFGALVGCGLALVDVCDSKGDEMVVIPSPEPQSSPAAVWG